MEQFKKEIFNACVRGILSNPGENLESSSKEKTAEKIADVALGLTDGAIKMLKETIEKQTSNVEQRRAFVSLYLSVLEGVLANPHGNLEHAEKKASRENPEEPLSSERSREITFIYLNQMVFTTSRDIGKISGEWKDHWKW